jgi:hypothetical protein
LQGEKKMDKIRQNQIISVVFMLVLTVSSNGQDELINQAPIADAGLPRYAATAPVQLDGSGSYDPDGSGPLTYTWTQISGPPVVISDGNSPSPMISGFVQTDEIQECEFELIVDDDMLISLPDTVSIIIIPAYNGSSNLRQENPPFDASKPTVVYFGGGDCISGVSFWGSATWYEKANVLSFSSYGPDPEYEQWRTYYHIGDLLILYLSSVATDYNQPIQTIGWSTGGQPAIDAAIRVNTVYQDARYAVNRVTHLDTDCRYLDQSKELYLEVAELFLNSSVDGEQCWLDCYYGPNLKETAPNSLQAHLGLGHEAVQDWYRNSLASLDTNLFNNGVVGGAYWSVIGPGKNLQLACHNDQWFYFAWSGDTINGQMRFYDEAKYPARLPEPVTLVEPNSVGDSNGVILTCEESENAIGYELLFGTNPYHVMDYDIISDTPTPPNDVVILPFEEGWWTVRVRDQYGSTIYADPKQIRSIASNPYPADGTLYLDTGLGLCWSAGVLAASHDVYFGENFEEVDAGDPGVFQGNQVETFLIIGLPGYPYPDGLIPGTTYYWRVDDVEANGTRIHKGNIWSFTVTPETDHDDTSVDDTGLL